MKLRVGFLVVFMLSLVPGIQQTTLAQQNRGGRGVFAQVDCHYGSGAAGSTFSATIKNQYGLPIVVSYAHGFTSFEALNPQFGFYEPSKFPEVTIDDGESALVEGSWDVFGADGRDFGMVLIVTTAGVLIPACGETEYAGLENEPESLPVTDQELQYESVAVFVGTYSRLLSWHAYPAMYALLHPDSQDLVSFWQLTCQLVSRYGTASNWKNFIASSEVTGVEVIDWTWAGGGIDYPDAVEVSYTSELATLESSDSIDSTMHLVQENGAWRWFFGSTPESIAALPDTCDAS